MRLESSAEPVFDPASDLVPAMVRGTLEIADPTSVAAVGVALAGRVEVVAEPLVDRSGVVRFATLVPEPAFRPGPNALDVVVAFRDGTLRRARLDAPR